MYECTYVYKNTDNMQAFNVAFEVYNRASYIASDDKMIGEEWMG
jgi:hypothetical protein